MKHNSESKVGGIRKRFLVFTLAFLTLFIFISIVSAELGLSDSDKPKLEAPELRGGTTNINYSTVNVNNSDYLDSYDSSAFAKLNEVNTFTQINKMNTITTTDDKDIITYDEFVNYLVLGDLDIDDLNIFSNNNIYFKSNNFIFRNKSLSQKFKIQENLVTSIVNFTAPNVCLSNGTNCVTNGGNASWNETRANTLYSNKPTSGINGSFAYNSSGTTKYVPYSFYNETNGVTTFSATSGSLTPGQTVLDVKGKIRMGYTAGTAENSAIQLLHGWGAMNRTSNQLMRFDGTINTGGVATTETYRIMQFEMGSISIPVGNTGGQANVYEASSWLTGIPAGATFGTINWFRSSPAYVSAGTVGLSNGFYSAPVLYSTGNVTSSNGAYIINPTYYSTGKVFYNHGIQMTEHTAGTVRNIGYLYGTAPASGNYTFYSSSTQESYFAGNMTTSGYKNASGSAGISGTYRYLNMTNGTCSMTYSQGLLMSATGCA